MPDAGISCRRLGASHNMSSCRRLGGQRIFCLSGNNGIEGHHRSLAFSAVTSSACFRLQEKMRLEKLQRIAAEKRVPFVQKNYDNTEELVVFGRLEGILIPVARYPVKYDGENFWRKVGVDEFLRFQRQERGINAQQTHQGIIHIMAQSAKCTWTNNDDSLEGFTIWGRPQALQRGNSSTIYRAVEGETGCMPKASEEALAECDLIFKQEIPDACTANKRKKAKSLQVMDGKVWDWSGDCGAHQGVRVVAAREKRRMGDIYSFYVTCSNTSLQSRLQAALKEKCQGIWVDNADPDPRDIRRNKEILKFTLMRRVQVRSGFDEHVDLNVLLDDDPAISAPAFYPRERLLPPQVLFATGSRASVDATRTCLFLPVVRPYSDTYTTRTAHWVGS